MSGATSAKQIDERLAELFKENRDFVEVRVKKRTEDDESGRGPIVYVCVDCRKIVEVQKLPRNKYTYKCTVCGGEHVALATESSAKNIYKLK